MMSPKILRRCTICKRYGAAYLVNDPLLGGKAYLCHDCWQKRQLPRTEKTDFNVATAKQYAQEGRLEEWVHACLNNEPGSNPGLSQGWSLQKRWWRGPLEVRLDHLQRCCGPEEGMEYRMELAAWQERTQRLSQSFTDLKNIPPLIVEYRAGLLSIRDGNHRYEAMSLKGWDTCWVLIWYNSAAEYLAHRE